MMRTTPSGPGSYPSRIWTDVHIVGPPSPPYTPEPTSAEESICAMLPSPNSEPSYSDDPLWSSTASFLYESPLVNISLGRRVWNLRLPVYGFNGIVQGAVKLSKKCSHVARVEVSLLGRIKMTTSDRGMISEIVNRDIVTSPVVLSCPERGQCSPTEQAFPFAVPFPSYVSGGTSPLPPSYAWWAPTFSCEVEYCVKVDVHRKGFRRHEMRVLPILYLPKTWPSHPVSTRESAFFLLSDPAKTEYKTVVLPPVWSADVGSRARATCPTVELFYPSGITYPSGQSFPVKLSIQSTEAPALAQLLIQGLDVELVKHMVAWSPSGQIVGGREVVLSKGNYIETDTTREGFAIASLDLTLGEPGKEQTWGVTEVLEVTYLIRVSVCCPDSALNFLPTYKHVSRIGVATEPWGTRERGLLGFGGFSDPAVEMGDERLQRRKPSSVNW